MENQTKQAAVDTAAAVEQVQTKRSMIAISKAKAAPINGLIAEVQRLSERPDVVALQSNQTFLNVLVKIAAEEAGMQIPVNYLVQVVQAEEGSFSLILTAQE